MVESSPVRRRSQPLSSPAEHRFSDFLSDDRNSELSHQEALSRAQAEHQRVREDADRVLKLHTQRLALLQIQEREEQVLAAQRAEEERLQKERKVREDEERLRALKAQKVPKLPPEPQPPQEQKKEQKSLPKPAMNGSGPFGNSEGTVSSGLFGGLSQPVASQIAAAAKPSPFASANTQVNGQAPRAFQSPEQSATSTATAAAKSTTPAANPFATTPSSAPKPAVNGFASTASGQIAAPAQPQGVPGDRYVHIHRNLKKLRAFMTEQAKSTPALKSRMGDMRREVRKTMGQLTSEKGSNRNQVENIKALLLEALTGRTPSAPVDPSDYVVENREPVPGAAHNQQLPSLFLFLLNQLAKAIVNQFINECVASPKSADPVGVVTAQIFSMRDYHWRGKSLIDILMAKFRIVCPVVFGYRGSEKTVQGRARLGWRQELDEQSHIDRMQGLGAGYASIALRDFSRSSNTNPWPPSRYWTAMANIVNTPPAEISNTQCVVLRSMISMSEDRFIGFYGSAALAALKKALVEFPGKAQIKSPGVTGLQVLAQVYMRDMGLDLS